MIFNNLFNGPDFQRFWSPTRIISGAGCRARALEMLQPRTETVLVVADVFTDHPFVAELERFIGADRVHIVRVDREPDYGDVDAALDRIGGEWKQLVALGGGSVLDLAKALLAKKLFQDYRRVGYGELRDVAAVDGGAACTVPFIALPTTAGSGSETSRYYVLVDPADHRKAASRAWAVCPQTALLDPVFLESMPAAQFVANAFDAFTHLWETYFCRLEHTALIRAIGKEGMCIIVRHLAAMERGESLDAGRLTELQLASAWSGIALSNVRTGLMHTSGEALAAQVHLSHPLTLWTFLEENLRLFHDAYHAQEDGLFPALARILGCPATDVLDALASLWRKRLAATGNIARIQEALRNGNPDPKKIVEACGTDHVLLTKEAPQPFDRQRLEQFVEAALARWTK